MGRPYADRVLMPVESVRHAANHQLALRIDDLRLKIVHATPDFLNLKGRAVDRLAFAVEIHPDLVVVLKRRAKCLRNSSSGVFGVGFCFFAIIYLLK